MGNGFTVDSEELRRHAQRLESLRDRFDAVKGASGHITQDEEAYGLLCGWISLVLEGRHVKQDELVDFVSENMSIAAGALRSSAEAYDDSDAESEAALSQLENELGAQ